MRFWHLGCRSRRRRCSTDRHGVSSGGVDFAAANDIPVVRFRRATVDRSERPYLARRGAAVVASGGSGVPVGVHRHERPTANPAAVLRLRGRAAGHCFYSMLSIPSSVPAFPSCALLPGAPRGAMQPGGVKGPTSGLSQQAVEAEGSLILEAQGRAGSSPDNAGTGRHRQTARVRQARRTGVTRVQNQWLNPLKSVSRLEPGGSGPGSSARQPGSQGGRLRSRIREAGEEATGKACGVAVARLQGKSWAPIPPIG